MNVFLNDKTALGKTIKTLVWVGVSAGVTALFSYIVNNPSLFNPYTVMVANVVFVALKNILNPDVPNV